MGRRQAAQREAGARLACGASWQRRRNLALATTRLGNTELASTSSSTSTVPSSTVGARNANTGTTRTAGKGRQRKMTNGGNGGPRTKKTIELRKAGTSLFHAREKHDAATVLKQRQQKQLRLVRLFQE